MTEDSSHRRFLKNRFSRPFGERLGCLDEAAPRSSQDRVPRETHPEVVRAYDVCKRFGAVEVLRKVSLSVDRGEVVSIIGPSGSGKTTLIRCINHLLPIDSGLILVNGRPLGYATDFSTNTMREMREAQYCRERSRVGMVFQHFNLFRNLSVIQNLTEAPMGVLGVPKREALERSRDALNRVGMSGREDDYPANLSGGQQQRVAIARALVMRPDLLLFDEPTSMLDPELVGEVLAVMRDLAQNGTTMIVVTHELQFAYDACEKVVFMADGEIVEEGSPSEVLRRPQHRRTREFLSRVSLGDKAASGV